jgi:hypothetical protein
MSLKFTTVAMGYQQITSLSASTGLTVPTCDPNGAKTQPTLAVIIADTQGVRWRDDGTAPTASIGMPLAVGVPLAYDGDLNKIRFIEQNASAVLNVSYYY